MAQEKLYAIDLFSGCGGVTTGLTKAGIEVKAAVEINPIAVKTYKINHSVNVIEDNICQVSGNKLLECAGITKKDILLLVACPPCQGFSSIRKGGENDERNQLIYQFIRLINSIHPEFILMENVAGMSRGKGKQTFQDALQRIQKNYVCVYNVVNAANYGVPQTRQRLVLHGIRKDVYKIVLGNNMQLSLPAYTHIDPTKKTATDNLPEWRNASVILGLPAINAGETYIGPGIYNHTCNDMSEINIKRIQYIRNHGGSRTCLPESLSLECHKGKTGHTDVYGIMDMNKPAPTITGGCMHYSKGRYGHPIQDRALSAREAARLQSFDDDYIFIGNNAEVALQIGNAVPVELAMASGRYFVNIFNVIKDEVLKKGSIPLN